MTQTDDTNVIDQAVTGYADGHRLLRCSTKLSTELTYHLAGISDMASDAAIRGGESYLTGLPVSDTHYGLIRTWLAPEMPRPGCVWSHILLVPGQTLRTQVDLTALLPLFRRPGDYKTDRSVKPAQT